jgi:hypothetical protein
MARLPVLRKRRSKREQMLDDMTRRYVHLVTIAKTSPRAAGVAMHGARHYAVARWSTTSKPSKARLLVIPVAVVGGVVVVRKVRSGGDNGRNPDFDRPLGPVASADTVSPPADAAAAAAQSEAPTPSESPAASEAPAPSEAPTPAESPTPSEAPKQSEAQAAS